MSLFEKIEPEHIEPEQIEPDEAPTLPKSTRQWGDEPLVVRYSVLMKVLLLVFSPLVLPICQAFLGEGLVFELLVVAGVAVGVWYLADCVVTRNITFFPDKIVRNGFFGRTVLPAEELVMIADEQKVRFFHGTEKNIRESILIRRVMVSGDEIADILKYAADVYRISRKSGGTAVTRRSSRPNNFALLEYAEAASSYWAMAVLLVVIALIALFTAGVAENFSGLEPGLPAFPARLVAMGLAALAFLLLRALAPAPPQGSSAAAPVEARLKKAGSASSASAAVACGVAILGLVLFFLFGNMLDFYLFLLVGVFYFYDFFPRLSAWEGQIQPRKTEESVPAAVVAPRRSLQVSLVLMGALAIASQGETQHYLYANRQDCLNDWGDGKDCQDPPPGSSHYGTHYYYGPRYGSGGGRISRSIGVGTISRGGFGSLGSFHASFGG
ncbi:MAG TPA: hypothetical protein VI298_01870 [Geobacteraceae bacterium]